MVVTRLLPDTFKFGSFGAEPIATFGDSWGIHTTNVPATATANVSWMDGKSPLAIAQAQSGGRVYFPYNLQFAVSGEKTDAILARADAAITAMQAAGVRYAVFFGDTNDRGFYTAAQTITNLIAIFEKFRLAGIVLIVVSGRPRGGGPTPATNRLSGTQLAEAMQVRQWYYDVAGRRAGIILCDMWRRLGLATSDLGEGGTNKLYDGLHPNQNGAYSGGAELAAIFRALFPSPVFSGGSVKANQWSADNPRGNWFPNGTMAGTGGSVGAGSTGSAADRVVGSRNAAFNGGTSMVTTWSKVAGAGLDEGKVWQQVVMSGTAAATAGPRFELQFPMVDNAGASLLANLAAGDRIAAMCRVEVDAGASNIKGIDFGSLFFDNATAYEGRAATIYASAGASVIQVPAGGYLGDNALFFIAPEITLTAPGGGVYLTGRARLSIDVMESAAFSMTMRVTDVYIGRVV